MVPASSPERLTGAGTRAGQILVATAVVASMLAFSPGDARAAHCTTGLDAWADGASWRDNRMWGDSCFFQSSSMIRAIQLIVNETSTGQGCWSGTPDGAWGPTTKAGVKCIQAWKGLTADGFVGPNTWGDRAQSPNGLHKELNYTGGNVNWLRYTLDLAGLRQRLWRENGGQDRWYIVLDCPWRLDWQLEPMDSFAAWQGLCW